MMTKCREIWLFGYVRRNLNFRWYAVDDNWPMPRILADSLNIFAKNSVPWSVTISFGMPNHKIKLFTKVLATVSASLFFIGYASINFVRSHCDVNIRLLSSSSWFKGPTISKEIFSNAYDAVVTVSGSACCLECSHRIFLQILKYHLSNFSYRE